MSYSNRSIMTMSDYISRCSELTDKESYVISMRLAGETLKNIGEKLGVQQERVRQIEARGLRRLYRRFINKSLTK